MQIKKFVAPTLKEAIESMKTEFGGEAIVLNTKVLGNGNGRKMFEITAGFDEPESKTEKRNLKAQNSSVADFEEELKKLSEKIYQQKRKPKFPNPAPEIIKEENKIDLRKVKERLIKQDINNGLAESIIAQLKKYSGLLNENNIDEHLVSVIGSMIPTESFEVKKNEGPKTIALVGPTGVGKTTCIAKLAVISKILHNLDIGLISIDTYRLGAMDQLKIFSEISNIDFYVAYEPSDLKKQISMLKKKDIIFIDTVGRSQNKPELLNGINDYLKAAKVDETYLVLSSTVDIKNMVDVALKFKKLNYNGLVFTKLDEAISYGNILNLVSSINKPVKYLTNGQVIPDDIIAADPNFIANMIYTGKIN